MARVSAFPAWASRSRLESIGLVAIVAVAFWYWLRYFNRSTNLLDEGSQAWQALRILKGELIYRDFFTVVTPGSYYTVAWIFQLFGTELIVLRWTVVVVGLLIVLATYVVARRLVAWPFAAAAALTTTAWGWLVVAPNFYSWEAALLALVAIACYLRYGDSGRPAWLISAGIATGLTILVKQNVGVYVAIAAFIALWSSRIFDTGWQMRARVRASALFAAGAALPVLPVLLFLIASGAGSYLYESWVYYPLVKYPGRFSLAYPSFYPVIPGLNLLTLRQVIPALLSGGIPEPAVFELWIRVVLYLPVIVYPFSIAAVAVLAWRFRRDRRDEIARHGRTLLAVTIFGAFVMLQAWPRADLTHILFGMQPTFVLFAYLSFSAWRGLAALGGSRPVITALALIVTLVPSAVLLWNGYRRTDWEYQNYIVALRADRGRGILAHHLEAHRIDSVTAYIVNRTAADDPIFVVPWASGFYFLTDRGNPTRTDFMLFEDPEAYPCLLARLDQRPPKYVIYGYVWDVDGRRFRDYAGPIDEYIRTRYRLEDSVDGYEIWRRIEEARQTPVEWTAACAPRRFRLRDFW